MGKFRTSFRGYQLLEEHSMADAANKLLIESAKSGSLDGIKKALEKDGADIEYASEPDYDSRALYLAAYNGHLDCVKYLVKAGAELDGPNRFDRNALYAASWAGHFEIAYWLWRRGASKYQLDKGGEQAAFSYQTPKEIAHWLNKEREGRDDEADPVFPGLVSSDEEKKKNPGVFFQKKKKKKKKK